MSSLRNPAYVLNLRPVWSKEKFFQQEISFIQYDCRLPVSFTVHTKHRKEIGNS